MAADRGPVCPYLGLVEDEASYFAYPSAAQRCHAKGRATPVDAAKQAHVCLAVEHVRCGRYRPPRSGGPDMVAVIGGGPRLHRPGSRSAGRRAVGLALLGLTLLLVAMIGIILGSGMAGRLSAGAPVASPAGVASNSPTAPSTEPASPAATPVPSLKSSPSTAPTPTPRPSPRTTAPPAPAPTRLVHVVRSGETLLVIAARYGVTVAAIQAANGIEDPNHIVTGQELVIPGL